MNLKLGLTFGDASFGPGFSSGFHLGWTFTAADTTTSLNGFGNEPTVEFHDIQLDLGSSSAASPSRSWRS